MRLLLDRTLFSEYLKTNHQRLKKINPMLKIGWRTLCRGRSNLYRNWKCHVTTVVNGLQPLLQRSQSLMLRRFWIHLEELQSLVFKVFTSKQIVINKSRFAIFSANYVFLIQLVQSHRKNVKCGYVECYSSVIELTLIK